MIIDTVRDLKPTLRNGPYVWPGGYPMFFITADGAALSFKSVRENLRQVMWAVKHQDMQSGWCVCGCDINWEDDSLYCEHSGERIESAYGENNDDMRSEARNALQSALRDELLRRDGVVKPF